MQGETQKNDMGTLKSSGSRIVLLLGIVSGVVLTLLCEGIWLAYFVWHHHMFILGVDRHGAAMVAVLIGLITIGAALLKKLLVGSASEQFGPLEVPAKSRSPLVPGLGLQATSKLGSFAPLLKIWFGSRRRID
jgi:hypothetical protein